MRADLALDHAAVEELAQLVAPMVAELVAAELRCADEEDGYLTTEAAARYLGISRKRMYDLRSSGAVVPDGFDGRTPLYKRATLDAYVRGQS